MTSENTIFTLDEDSEGALHEAFNRGMACSTFEPDFDGIGAFTFELTPEAVAALNDDGYKLEYIDYVFYKVELERTESTAYMVMTALPYQWPMRSRVGAPHLTDHAPRLITLRLGEFENGVVSTSGQMMIKRLNTLLDRTVFTFYNTSDVGDE